MMLIILHKHPNVAAQKLPKRIKHKQLLELAQMVSGVVGFGYREIPQGKEIKDWIRRNKVWVYNYMSTLYFHALQYSKSYKKETLIKYRCLLELLECAGKDECKSEITTGIIRYQAGYKCKHPSNSEIPIDECIKIYKDYVKNYKEW